MILTPTAAPPQPRADPVDASPQTTVQKALLPPLKPLDSAQPPCTERAMQDDDEKASTFLERLKVPTVVLETQSISHTMAAALSLSLLGHTLFLKNQVPFPVAQLSRVPGGMSNPKVVKKRDELLATLDTLTSHLQTTFVALSTAYARCKSAVTSASTPTTDRENEPPQLSTTNKSRRGTAHLMIVIGPSVPAARARILLTIDGLDVKIWGARPVQEEEDLVESDSEEDNDSQASEEDGDSDTEEDDELSDEQSSEDEDSGSEDYESADDASDAGSSDVCSGPPSSRSPSPLSPPARSLAPSPESLPSPKTLPTSLPVSMSFTFTHPLPSSTRAVEEATSISAPPRGLAPRPTPPQPRMVPKSVSRENTPTSVMSYAEEQQTLRAAERLLSRTLMNAWVNSDGEMSNELAPTQTHIYLRAPRRFVHPAWAARQNLTRTLDGVLSTFLEDSGAVPAPASAKTKSKPLRARGVRTEGAWVGCRGGSAFTPARSAERGGEDVENDGDGERAGQEREEVDEDDEEIWWAWDGKIVGFAGW